jgi:hypothetical protein
VLNAELTRLRKLYKVDAFVEPPAPPDPKKVELELVLRWDPDDAAAEGVRDLSGKGHRGTGENVRIVDGRSGQAMAFDGTGSMNTRGSPPSLDPTYRPITVGAWCRPAARDGVIVAHGSSLFGYSLYLKDGVPRFTLYAGQNRFDVTAREACPMNAWVHLAATIDADARIILWVNSVPVDQLDEGFHVNDHPPDAFSVGSDAGQPAGDYDGAFPFRGLIDDVRVYWGVLGMDALREWAGQR